MPYVPNMKTIDCIVYVLSNVEVISPVTNWLRECGKEGVHAKDRAIHRKL